MLPVSIAIDNQPAYTTAEEAMNAAAQAAIALSRDNEVGGALFKQGNVYHYTLPVTQGSAKEIDYRIALPADVMLIALWHTHPGAQQAEQFSDSDKALAKAMRLPMYVVAVQASRVIGLGCDGFVLGTQPVHYASVTIAGKAYHVLACFDNYCRLSDDSGRTFKQWTHGKE